MEPKTEKRFGWFGVLLIAVFSGLVVRILGDPLAEVTTPKLKRFLRHTQDFVEDHEPLERLQKWLERHD
jgi:hypothetical protein